MTRIYVIIYITFAFFLGLLFHKIEINQKSSPSFTTTADLHDIQDVVSSLHAAFDKISEKIDREAIKYKTELADTRKEISSIRLELSQQSDKTKGKNMMKRHSSKSRLMHYEVEPAKNNFQFSQINNDNIGRRLEIHGRCEEFPILSPINHINNFVYDERVDRILDMIQTISSRELLNSKDSPQYKAACWIMFVDELLMSEINQLLIQRYVLAVFLFAKNPNEVSDIDTCDYHIITCDDRGFITALNSSNTESWGNVQTTIPSEFSQLRHLENLFLERSRLIGTIPSEIGSLSNLQVLNFDRNELSGTLPSEIGRLLNLRELRIGWNDLVGSIPFEIGHLAMLNALRLTNNAFTNSIPVEIYNCTRLRILDLSINALKGTLSENIAQVKELQELRLSDNMFSGTIPSQIGSLSSLQVLGLSFNELTGTLSKEIINIGTLQNLNIEANHLTGVLPNLSADQTKLSILQLSVNGLTGTIPRSIWNHENYFALLLQGNNLRGTVPETLCSTVKNLKVDNSIWFRDEPKVDCDCCQTANCYLWQTNELKVETALHPPCPLPNIHSISFFERYIINDHITGKTFQERVGNNNHFSAEICLSPLGCYSLRDDPKTSLDYDLNYSKSSNGLSKEEKCGSVDVCGELFDENHPRRKGLNLIAQLAMYDLQKLNDPSSTEYEALCWIMTTDTLFDDFEICDGTLLQRYVLAFFYKSYSESFDFSDFSFKHTCEWPGVTCDPQSRFVEVLDLSNCSNCIKILKKSLDGTLTTEIGLLTRLKKLDLSENELTGNIDSSIFVQMPNLNVVHLGGNNLRGEIPKELLMLPALKELNISHNKFVGTLPSNHPYAKNLETFIVGNNLLQGTIPYDLIKCRHLEFMILSRNGFNGEIPTTIGWLENLKVVKMNGNRLTGSIPIEIFGASNIEEFVFEQNMLTGSIPSHIGDLSNLTIISLNDNLLKGKVPEELKNLNNIELLRLHHNLLTGNVPDINVKDKKNISAFIADCGEPSFLLSSPLSCPSCTMCCNSLNLCQQNSKITLPFQKLAIIVVTSVPIGITFVAVVMFQFKKKGYFSWFADNRSLLSIYNEDSVYCLIFSNNLLAWFAYFLTATIQAIAFYLFLLKSNFNDDDTAVQFTYRCPTNSMDCQNEATDSALGWFMLTMALVYFLGADFVDSFHQLCKSAELMNVRLFISGFIHFFLTALAFFTSIVYNIALAESNTDLVINAVFLLFINEMDEQFLSLLDSFAPSWIVHRYHEIEMVLNPKSDKSHEHDGNENSHDNGDNDERAIFPERLIERQSSFSSRLRKGRFTGLREVPENSIRDIRDLSLVQTSDRFQKALMNMFGMSGSVAEMKSNSRINSEEANT